MKRLGAALILGLILVTSVLSRAETYRQIRIAYPDQSTLIQILRIGLEPIFGQAGEYLDFAISEEDIAQFNDLSIPYTIIHDDMTAFYQSRNPLGLTMGGYRTFDEMVAVMDSFATAYPEYCTPKFSIATTEQGRSLWTMKISDNPDIDEDEPEVFVCSIIHAREPIGGEITLEFMRYLLTQYGSDPIATNLVDNYQLYFLPVINPDGYEYNRQIAPSGGGMWRKNRRNNWDGTFGVDLNRNFSYFWGYDDIGSSPVTNDETYRGPAYASEPEAMGIINFVNAHDFAILLNYHAYGDDFLYPWGYYDGLCDDHAYYDTLAAYSRSIGYAVGAPWQLLYNTNGDIADWSYGEDRLHRRCFGEVIEVGTNSDGFWPPQNRIAPLVNENLNLLKDLLPRALDTYKRRLPQMPTITSPSIVGPNTPFYLHWQPSVADTFNLAASYKLTMLSDHTRGYQTFESTSGFTLHGFTQNGANHHSGLYSVYSGQGSNVRNYVTLDERLQVEAGEALTFWARYNIQEGYDYAYVQVSSDGGETWWEVDGNLSTSENPHRRNKGFGITGSSGGNWVQGNYPLRNYVGEEIRIRFSYWTDASGNNEGIYIDDVYPNDVFGTITVLGENITAESLLVGPYPVGQRWFKVEPTDDRGQIGPPSNRFRVEIQGNLYSLSGQVGLDDTPADLSGSLVSIPAVGLFDSTDITGSYNIAFVPEGNYNLIASHLGYFPDTTFSFTISSDTTLDFILQLAPPPLPALLEPVENAALDSEFVDFDWSDSPRADRYILEVASDSVFNNIVVVDSNLITSSYQGAGPFGNGPYFWRVTAHNPAGYSPSSSVWPFTVNVMLPMPVLVSPDNGAVPHNAVINFDWNDVGDSSLYIFELSTDPEFTQMVIVDSSVAGSNYSNSSPLEDIIYFWRVKATNGVYWSPYSDTWSFIVRVDTLYMAGDANSTGHVNGMDVVFLVNYFKGRGPTPNPYLAADANGTCNVNGLDITYLVNYFKGGPYPLRADCQGQP